MNRIGSIIATILLASIVSSNGATVPPQRFEAERFLDMLAKTFDAGVAYRDLLAALHKRLNIVEPTSAGIPASTTNGTAAPDAAMTGAPGTLEPVLNCPDADPIEGTVVTYTNEPHISGSRAFYQCEIGYTGSSRFIQCEGNGLWSSTAGYSGCTPIDCGIPLPTVQHATASPMRTTYGAIAYYECDAGYTASSPDTNSTCSANGQWSSPTFTCDKVSVPQLNPASLGGLSAMFGGPGAANQGANAAATNPMMEALMKTMANMGGMANMQQGAAGAANPMMANLVKMFPNLSPSVATPPPTTTTTTPRPPQNQNRQMNGGFQLPSHLQSLLPNGMANTQGVNPNDLMALASMGLGGAGSAGGAPGGLNQLFGSMGSMNPMQAMFGGPGMGAGAPGGRGMGPDPEKAAEQREEMMMRAMMASAMKSMMAPRGNSTAGQSNGGADMLALMALQNSLGGGGGGSGMAAGGMDPAMMMFGGMNPAMLGLGGGSPAGMFGGGGAGMFGGLGSLFGGA